MPDNDFSLPYPNIPDVDDNPTPVAQVVSHDHILMPNGQARQIRGTMDGDVYTAPRTWYTPQIALQGVSFTAYAANDCLGTLFAIAVPDNGLLTDVLIIDPAGSKQPIDFVLWRDPKPSQTADNAAWAPTADDYGLNRIAGIVQVSGGAFITTQAGTMAIGELCNVNKVLTNTGGKLWVQPVIRGITTLTAGTTYIVQFSGI